jgi:hypothetical protein
LLATHDLRFLAAPHGEGQAGGRGHQRQHCCTHGNLPPPGKRTEFDWRPSGPGGGHPGVGNRPPATYIGGIPGRTCRFRSETTTVTAGSTPQPCRFGLIGINSQGEGRPTLFGIEPFP